MEFRITPNSRRRTCAALTLPEMLVAVGISTLVLLATLSFFLYCNRSFVHLTNHVFMEQQNSAAMDRLSQQIRQAQRLTAYSSTSLSFLDYDGAALQFSYDPVAQTLSRIKSNQTNVLLTGCTSLNFQVYASTLENGTFDATTVATNVSQGKVVSVTWTCFRTSRGVSNYEPLECAKILIRNANGG